MKLFRKKRALSLLLLVSFITPILQPIVGAQCPHKLIDWFHEELSLPIGDNRTFQPFNYLYEDLLQTKNRYLIIRVDTTINGPPLKVLYANQTYFNNTFIIRAEVGETGNSTKIVYEEFRQQWLIDLFQPIPLDHTTTYLLDDYNPVFLLENNQSQELTVWLEANIWEIIPSPYIGDPMGPLLPDDPLFWLITIIVILGLFLLFGFPFIYLYKIATSLPKKSKGEKDTENKVEVRE